MKNLKRKKTCQQIVIQSFKKSIKVSQSSWFREMFTLAILNDNATKFEKIKTKKGILNFSINHERRINDYLKSLDKSGSLTTHQFKKIEAIGSRPGILYEI